MAEYALKGVSSRSPGDTRDAAMLPQRFHHRDDDDDDVGLSEAILQTRLCNRDIKDIKVTLDRGKAPIYLFYPILLVRRVSFSFRLHRHRA